MRRSTIPARIAALAVTGLAVTGALLGASPAIAAAPGDLSIDFTAYDIEKSEVSSDGATIALSSYVDSTITLIDTATNTATTVADPGGDVNGPGGVVFSPDNTTLYVANFSGGNLVIIDVASATISSVVFDTGGEFVGPWTLARDLTGTTLYVGDYTSGVVHFFDIATSTVTTSVDISLSSPEMYGLYASADGTQLFVVDSDGSIDVIQVNIAGAINSFMDAVLGDSYGGCISPDRLSLFQPDTDNPALYKSSLETGAVLASNLATVRPQDSEHTACAVSPDGASVFVTHYNAFAPGSVTEYDATTLAFIATHDFPGIEYTQQIQFFSECQAYVVGYFGDAQTLDLDCTVAPELAATGLDAQGVALVAGFSALLVGVGVFALHGRRLRAERLATLR